MFAGSFRGITQTVPLAIYDRFATDFPAALALSAVLVAVSRRHPPRPSSSSAAARRSAVLRVEARTRLGALELDVALAVAAGRVPGARGPVGRGQDERAARGRRAAAAASAAASSAAGEIWLDTARGVDVPPERRRCGYVFQEYALFPHLSASHNVAYSAARRAGTRRERALALLERFGLARAGRRPAAARSRAASASASRWRARSRASPSVLLLDEPLSALDARTRAQRRSRAGGGAARGGRARRCS